jgi:hypothetical protein
MAVNIVKDVDVTNVDKEEARAVLNSTPYKVRYRAELNMYYLLLVIVPTDQLNLALKLASVKNEFSPAIDVNAVIPEQPTSGPIISENVAEDTRH